MKFHSEALFAKRYDFVIIFRTGEDNKLPNIVPLSVSVLVVVTNKVETTI